MLAPVRQLAGYTLAATEVTPLISGTQYLFSLKSGAGRVFTPRDFSCWQGLPCSQHLEIWIEWSRYPASALPQ